MNSTIHEPQIDLLPSQSDDPNEEIRAQVWGVLTTLYPRNQSSERRHENRYPFPYLVHLTPVDEDGVSPSGESLVVVGKHLSERGVGFYHPHPIPHRRMIASLDAGNGQTVGFLVDLNWCRFTGEGWYESGGKFLQAVLPPSESL